MEKKKISDYINIPKDLAPSPPESQILKLFDEKDLIPKSIYHYTSVDGLKSIVENRKLWFTHTSHLNDPGEVFYSIEHFFNELSKIGYDFPSLLKMICKEKYENLFNNPPHFFVCCFTSDYDSLPLWSMYTQMKGVCIEFECNDQALNNDSTLRVHFVRYTIESLIEKANILKKLLKEYFPPDECLQNRSVDSFVKTQIIDQVNTWIDYVEDSYHLFKNKKYEYEKEIRFSLPCRDSVNKNSVLFREKNNCLIPYIEFDYTKFLTIKSITISPGQARIKPSLKFFLEQNKLCDKKVKNNDNDFLKLSEIPYRV